MSTREPFLLHAEDIDSGDPSVDEAIAACGGGMRDTIRALLILNDFLQAEIDRQKDRASFGYQRRKPGPS